MIEIKRIGKDDIFESAAQTLTNPINCQGVMGKGLALEFKKRFPAMFDDYLARCKEGRVKMGKPYLFKTLTPPWILNFPTKKFWRSFSLLSDIELGLKYLLQHYKDWKIESLAVPPLGCSNGRLAWQEVGPLLYKYLNEMDIPVEIYVPNNAHKRYLTIEYLSGDAEMRPLLPEYLAIVGSLEKYLARKGIPHVNRTVFRGFFYFAKVIGIPINIAFKSGPYGPYSDKIDTIISVLLNREVIREYSENGRSFAIEIGKRFESVKKLNNEYLMQWEAQIDRLSGIMGEFQTSREIIVAAAVHQMFAQEGKITENAIIKQLFKTDGDKKAVIVEEVETVAKKMKSLDLLTAMEQMKEKK